MTTLYPFDLWTILVACVGNVACALLGCFLVLRRLSLLGDAISHAVLPGIAVAFLLTGRINGVAIFLASMIVGVLTAWLAETLQSLGKVAEDASLGIVFTMLFSLGVVLINRYARQVDLDPGCVLYGALELVAFDNVTLRFAGRSIEFPRSLIPLSAALGLTLTLLVLLWKEWKLTLFDPALAKAMGFPAKGLHYLLTALVAGTAVAAFESVGSILVVAMLIVPGATAQLLTDRLVWMLVWAAAIGAAAGVLGYIGAVWFNTNAAGMMAVTAGLFFLLAIFVAPRQGVIARAVNRVRLALHIASQDVLGGFFRAEEAAQPAPPAATAEWTLRRWFLLGRLRRLGSLMKGPHGWTLTDKGRHEASSVVRAHRLWESYLGANFALPEDHLHEPAERIEHFLDSKAQEALARELEQPRLDPHGRIIPAAEPQKRDGV